MKNYFKIINLLFLAIILCCLSCKTKEALKCLQEDKEAKVLRLAIKALVREQDMRAVPLLIDILFDEKRDEGVRASAGRALGKLKSTESFDALIKFIQTAYKREKNCHYVVSSVIRALGNYEDEWVTIALLYLIKMDGAYQASDVANVFRKRKDKDKIIIELINSLKAVNDGTLHRGGNRIADILGYLGDKRAADELLRSMNVNYVRRAAIVALGLLKEKRAIPELLRIVKERKKSNIFVAYQALERIADSSAVPVLIEIIGKKEKYWQNALEALYPVVDKRAEKTLIALLPGDTLSSENRMWALRGILKICDKNLNITPILSMCRHKGGTERGYAVEILAKVGNRVAAPHVLPLLGDKDDTVRTSVIQALPSLCDNRTEIQLLTEYCNSDQLDIQCAVLNILGKIGNTKAVQAIIPQLDHRSSDVRKCAIKSLGLLKSPAAIKALTKSLINDKRETNEKLQALVTLWKDDTPRNLLSLLKKTEYKHPLVAFAAEVLIKYDDASLVVPVAKCEIYTPDHYMCKAAFPNNLDATKGGSFLINAAGKYPAEIERLCESKDVKLKSMGFRILGQSGEKGINCLLDMIREKKPEWKFAVSALLYNRDYAKGIETIKKLLTETKDKEVRQYLKEIVDRDLKNRILKRKK